MPNYEGMFAAMRPMANMIDDVAIAVTRHLNNKGIQANHSDVHTMLSKHTSLNQDPSKEAMELEHSKAKYKPLTHDELRFTDPNEVWTAKIDGAHSEALLKKGEKPEVYSYRVSKRTGESIPYTDKLPHLPEKSLVDAKVRMETYAVTPNGKAVKPEVMISILGSGADKSLDYQKQNNLRTRTALINIDEFAGKDVRNMPFETKRKLLEIIAKAHPEYNLPEMAVTPKEKYELYHSIQNKTHPQTEEGIVVHQLKSSNMAKFKFSTTHDVYVRKLYPEFSESGRIPMIGAIGYSHSPEGDIVGRVGSGFDFETKKDMYKNPGAYEGKVMRVTARGISPNNVLLKPSFAGWDIDKNIGKETLTNLARTKLDEFAPGIPKGREIKDIPQGAGEEWEFTIQKHVTSKDNRTHFDFRIADKKNQGHSWALPKGLPEVGEKKLGVQQNTHTKDYFDFTGAIESGYGKGYVEVINRGKVRVLESSNDKVKFILGNKTYVMIHTNGPNWIIIQKQEQEKEAQQFPSMYLDSLESCLTNLVKYIPSKIHDASNMVMKLRACKMPEFAKDHLPIKQEADTLIKDMSDQLVKIHGAQGILKDAAIKLPELNKGDTILGGKFKNVKMELKGTKTDDNNQPVLETSKGDIKAFKFRIEKLMPNKEEAEEKTAGGPGSGVSSDNTAYILEDFSGLKMSPLISIGKRKAFMDANKPISTDTSISLEKVKYVCQEKYVPKKLSNFLESPDSETKPIDVLIDKDEQYHILDGHHRSLAAIKEGKETIKANIYDGSSLENKEKVGNLLTWNKMFSGNKDKTSILLKSLV